MCLKRKIRSSGRKYSSNDCDNSTCNEKEADKTTYTAELMSAIKPRKMGFYEKYIKRGMDVICASAAILCFSPIYAGVAL